MRFYTKAPVMLHAIAVASLATLTACMADTVIRPAISSQGLVRPIAPGDRYGSLTDAEYSRLRALSVARDIRRAKMSPNAGPMYIEGDCIDSANCGGAGGAGGGGGGGTGDPPEVQVPHTPCMPTSTVCTAIYAWVDDGDHTAEAMASTWSPTNQLALMTVIGGGILKKGLNLSLPTGIALLCVQFTTECRDDWQGASTCQFGDYNFMAVGTDHRAVYSTVRYTDHRGDTDSCNAPTGTIYTFDGGGGGSSDAGEGDAAAAGDDAGEGNIVVTTYPNQSSCTDYQVVEIWNDGNENWTVVEYEVEVCDE